MIRLSNFKRIPCYNNTLGIPFSFLRCRLDRGIKPWHLKGFAQRGKESKVLPIKDVLSIEKGDQT